MSRVAYGEGVTAQMREDFLVKYGCSAYTDEILAYLVENLAFQRGIIEVGAGNGQWARALSDRYDEHIQKPEQREQIRKNFDFILPYDDKTSLPLSPQIYHKHTKPAALYFHPDVRTSDSANSMLRKWENRGRVLLLVYPPPGPMALETVKTYVNVCPERNDLVVYVGEGKGGANGNDELFDYWLNSGEWAVVKIMDVRPSPGGKGFEKMFVLKRVRTGEESV
uniref:Methyltransferase domain-containing protein n=1 Tax=Ditylum brightwellii TaxID=49249 RepID=A0A7S2ELR4_9STRA